MEIKTGGATVRIHGTVDSEKLRKAAEEFLKRAEAQRKKGGSASGECAAKAD